ncbi:FAD-dependent monooxygenase [Candidatus Erwinia haradaeae]|uniref:2-octaprenyl-3-methyl-6-methoxy-1,4-benzoquinol hydroxylase n=1 Tax=Candidatus Erwinia haradaeae TaxID=1922217 RepID=A0A451DA47_9GAMM|nr:FAD-dependent monooxygenase [Candidatus Erwinia haradaeae]VFP83204.1 2-octaprenyl-3-methyl-6-methoxy-1,4-benzoquinol hydroxylase [Candidatus Erwinia haradaeae]
MLHERHKNTIEIIIVGGGMIGAALASGLSQHGFEVVVLEAASPPIFNPLSYPDLRISAITAASVSLLKKIGVWPRVLIMRCAPYRTQEIWEYQIARVIFNAQSLGLSELGYMVENHVLKYALSQQLYTQSVPIFYNTRLIDLQKRKDYWNLILNNGKNLQARLVVGADGAYSQVRQLVNITWYSWRYAQSCLLISVYCSYNPGDSTWQQLTPSGPRAFLPLFGRWALLVWYDEPAQLHRLQSLTMSQLQKEIQRHFPSRVGKVNPLATTTLPLYRSHAKHYILSGLALVGDAAHTLHPLAGQGVNLGYRDVSALITVLREAREHSDQWASIEVLQRYQEKRQKDNYLMQNGIDLLNLTFSHTCLPFTMVRNLGFIIANHAGKLKKDMLSYGLGL